MKVDLKLLDSYVERKLLSCQKHPEADLLIYNYTHRCQFEHAWDDVTLMCRGLIVHPDGTVHAQPFKKFFNLDEKPEVIPTDSHPLVFEKLDGSLGITYWHNGIPYVATRGSFTSVQAVEGTRMLHERIVGGLQLDQGLTYLFEIIYPENRIVVNYGDERRLVLLGVTNPETGDEVNIWECMDDYLHFDRPRAHLYEAIEAAADNAEGYVFWWPQHGVRAKVKFDEYKRLHRLITGVNKRRIWEMLRNEQSLDELLERVPDEFYAWVRKMVSDLESDYQAIELQAKEAYEQAKELEDRKAQALAIKNHPYRGIIFTMLDERPYADGIWRLLRPASETPFKVVDMGDA